jgi:ribosomal protein L19E
MDATAKLRRLTAAVGKASKARVWVLPERARFFSDIVSRLEYMMLTASTSTSI